MVGWVRHERATSVSRAPNTLQSTVLHFILTPVLCEQRTTACPLLKNERDFHVGNDSGVRASAAMVKDLDDRGYRGAHTRSTDESRDEPRKQSSSSSTNLQNRKETATAQVSERRSEQEH
mmetsp:Transcript_914/g.2588  ORF Transcript_914/g.2588 Transcript_914/m.2588 type:complete len:120 (+) Transcript_914:746-1105(+)